MKSVSQVGTNLGLSQTQSLMLGSLGALWASPPAGGYWPTRVAPGDVGSYARLAHKITPTVGYPRLATKGHMVKR